MPRGTICLGARAFPMPSHQGMGGGVSLHGQGSRTSNMCATSARVARHPSSHSGSAAAPSTCVCWWHSRSRASFHLIVVQHLVPARLEA